MATISTADFKNGIGLRIKDKICTLVEFQHVKPGKGGAFVRYKTKDIKTGRVVEQTCNAGSKFESVHQGDAVSLQRRLRLHLHG